MSRNNRLAIEQLEQLLASGLRSHTVDGQAVTYASRDDILAEIRRLKAEDTSGNYTTRQRIRTVRLGGF